MGKYTTLSCLILWRLISVFIVQTAHVPDEYWQGLEVAHKLAFGYGHLTWEWHLGIRSYIYPFLISILYKILDVLRLDHAEVLLVTPKLFQALLSGYADYRFYLWTNKSKTALFSLVFNWYWYYCATRTLINSVETAVTTIALSIFPWQSENNRGSSFLWLVAFLCYVRPTAAIIWLPLCLYYLYTRENNYFAVILRSLLMGGVIFGISVLIDSLFYGKFIITPWEFLKVNVLLKISDFYGVNSMFWYFLAGLPTVLGLQILNLPLASYEIFKRPAVYLKQSVLLVSVVWTLFVYSFLSHKEFRFILPLLPMLIYITSTVHTFTWGRKSQKFFRAAFLLSNLLPGLYFSFLHQRGSLDVMKFLRRHLPNDDNSSLLFLTPCHSIPLYSHLHRNVSARFLTCEPNLENVRDYVDEADRFFLKPMVWLNENYKNDENIKNETSLPTHLIIFDNVVDKVSPFLKTYRPIATIFYAHFTQGKDERLDELVMLNLELMEEKVAATIKMEQSLRNAQIELAKAKMICGKEAIGTTQIPIHTDNVTSLFELQREKVEKDGCTFSEFDISLRQSSDIQNPLKWFGILVPQSLKSAQKHFQESIYQSIQVANIQMKLISVLNDIKRIKKSKNVN